MSYQGLSLTVSEEHRHLGGNVAAGDPFTYCPSVCDYVIGRFAIASVLDLGSGSGNASEYFFRKGLRVIAADGLRQNIESSLYPTVQIDLTKTPIISRIDLVHCQEVVEHIDEYYLDNLLDSLACGRVVLMTHALPGQDGHHHVNLQPPEYWMSHLASRGLNFVEEDSLRVRKLAERDGAEYMQRTGMVFVNQSRL
jgi:SAM-dependent methyltransferase